MTEQKYNFGQLVSLKINDSPMVFRVGGYREFGLGDLYYIIWSIDDEHIELQVPESMLEAV